MLRIGALFGALGGIVAVVSIASGFVAIGADPLYQARAIFGILALALSVVAAVSGFLPRLHPAAAGALMLGTGTLGFLATLLWYINMFYVAALPLWLIGAALLVGGAFSARRA
ncbi:MAG TPA: hypothetical protein VE338_16895 [Ktedonobacterales bacterium]|jgi:uncharacterized membrane protein HdeD (DUF308 family)|nr:hypothetical protein [Ktedonobacterales bacterium]